MSFAWLVGLLIPIAYAGPANATIDPGQIAASAALPDEVTKLRDPFKRVAPIQAPETPKSELETIPTEKFKLLGVVTGLHRIRAMIQGPNNKTYFVTENMHIGVRRGVIRKIKPDSVQVREKILNVLGQEESLDVDIKLPQPEKDTIKSGEGW